MISGCSGSGITTFANSLNKDNEYIILEVDDYLNAYAASLGKFPDEIIGDSDANKKIEENYYADIKKYTSEGKSIILTDANSLRSRRYQLSLVPSNYAKISYLLNISVDEIKRRYKKSFDERGLVYNEGTIAKYYSIYNPPSSQEFDELYKVGDDGVAYQN